MPSNRLSLFSFSETQRFDSTKFSERQPLENFVLWNRSWLFAFSGQFVDTYIYIYTYIHLYTSIYIYTHLYTYIYIYIYIDMRKQPIAANISNRLLSKFAALDLFVDISSSIRKQPIAANFAKRFLGEICCDWLISGYLSQEATNYLILGRNLL